MNLAVLLDRVLKQYAPSNADAAKQCAGAPITTTA